MKLRKIWIAALTLAASVCIAFGLKAWNVSSVSAATMENTSTFQMENGASARVKTLTDADGNAVESNGLRFCAEISQAEYDALKSTGARFGVVIVAKDLLKGVEITEETVFGVNPSFYFSNETAAVSGKIAMLNVANAACENIDKDANIEICGSIVNLQVSNFTRSFIGRVYVALPNVDASGAVTGYTYQFAPYYENNVENNTRCIYYVAQRAVEEESANASVLQQKYLDVFAKTDRFTKYVYRYTVLHHYIGHNENGEDIIIHTEEQPLYAELNSTVTAHPIAKPEIDKLKNMNFIFDVEESINTQTGLVYAAGMQTLHLYYEKASTISEEHKDKTLETLIEHFLDPENAEENFHLDMIERDENGDIISGSGAWEAEKVIEKVGDTEEQIGISLTTYKPNSDTDPILAKEFFEELRAFGVESMTFKFHTASKDSDGKWTPSSKKMVFNIYKGNEDDRLSLPVHLSNGKTIDAGDKITISDTEITITIYLADIMDENGNMMDVGFKLASSTSSNKGIYHFGDITFGFPTSSATLD